MKEEYSWAKHIDDYKAEKLLKVNQKNKRLQIDMRLMKERMVKLREENEKLRQTIKKQKESNPTTSRMTSEDYNLYLDGVALVKSDYINSLKQQLADLYRRKLELDGKKDTALNRTKRHINAIAMGSVLSDIEAYEANRGAIKFKY